ncbi:M23 family metallopeptidase [Aurantibacter sp.]|uniref:M23 family metallopeptidase n=1 Tax=Aurantibacter sp. TaxID=2807103 RepID=UPI0035C7CC06
MVKKQSSRKILSKKLLHKYRLVILNEDTFEERLSFKLTRLNVFILGVFSSVILISLTTFLIAFTPLKEYIPGYSSSALKHKAVMLSFKADSLQNVININNKYFNSIKKVLSGDVKAEELDKDSIASIVQIEATDLDFKPSKQDSVLRSLVEREDKYSVFENAETTTNFVLFPPVNGGVISEDFDVKKKHYAVDLVVAKNTPVKATADGIVVFSDFTTQAGNVIILEHSDGLISVYKHNSRLSKSQGDLIKAGEVIATAGNTGEISTGPHVHFELWSNGYPVNPNNFIDFK